MRLAVFFDGLPTGQAVEIHSLHRDCTVTVNPRTPNKTVVWIARHYMP